MSDDFDFAARFREAQKVIEENLRKELEENPPDLSVDDKVIEIPFKSIDNRTAENEIINVTNFRNSRQTHEEPFSKKLRQEFNVQREIPYSSVDDTFFVSDDSTEDDELVIDITNSETFRQSHEEPSCSTNLSNYFITRSRSTKSNTTTSVEAVTISSDSDSDFDSDFISKPAKAEETEEDFNYEQTVLVKWLYLKNYRIPLRRFQNLSVLQGELAKLENIKAENIILLLEGKILDPNECLHTLNITPKDVIYAMHTLEETTGSETTASSSGLKFKIQMKDTKKPLNLHIKANDIVKVLLGRISEELGNIPLSKLRLKFDGDVLVPEKTAVDQDLEGGECLDLEIIDR